MADKKNLKGQQDRIRLI